jgi:hypothetical protein
MPTIAAARVPLVVKEGIILHLSLFYTDPGHMANSPANALWINFNCVLFMAGVSFYKWISLGPPATGRWNSSFQYI